MKCYILRWNPERNTFKQKDFEEFQTDFNNGEVNCAIQSTQKFYRFKV